MKNNNKMAFSVEQSCNMITNADTFNTFEAAKNYAIELYDKIPIMPRISVYDINTGDLLDGGNADVFFDFPIKN